MALPAKTSIPKPVTPGGVYVEEPIPDSAVVGKVTTPRPNTEPERVAMPEVAPVSVTEDFNSNLKGLISPAQNVPVTNVTPVSSVAAPLVAPRTISGEETVAGQLNALLSKESTYIQSARNRGMEVANSRGLINSSLAAGTSERAAIDAAMPIATQDANTYAQSGMSAQQANQDTSLTGYKGLIDSAQKSEDFGYTTATNAQNIQANTDLQNSRIALDLSRLGLDQAKMNETQKTAVTTAMGPIIQQLLSEESKIQQMPDEQMSPESKQMAIAELRQSAQTRAQTIADLYGYPLNWPAWTDSPATPPAPGSPAASNPAPSNPSPAQVTAAQAPAKAAAIANARPYDYGTYEVFTQAGGTLTKAEFDQARYEFEGSQ